MKLHLYKFSFMLRPVAIALLCCCFNSALGQEPVVKCDSLRKNETGDKAIVFKGKKTGLYSFKDTAYLFEMSTYPVFEFDRLDGREIYGRAPEGRIGLMAFDDGGTRIEFFDRDTAIFTSPQLGMYMNMDENICFNDRLWDINTLQRDTLKQYFSHYNRGLVKLGGNRVIVTDYDRTDQYMNIEETYISVPGHCKSGVYDGILKSWIVPKKYLEIDVVNGYYFCSYFTEEASLDGLLSATYFYDVYDNSGAIFAKKIQLADLALISTVLGLESIEMCTDSVHFITTKNGKKGLIRFQLMNEWYGEDADFSYQSILGNDHEYLWFSRDLSKAITYNSGRQFPMTLYHYIDGWLDENAYVDVLDSIIGAKERLLALRSQTGYDRIVADNKEYRFAPVVNTGFLLMDAEIEIAYDDYENPFWNYDFRGAFSKFGIKLVFENKLVQLDMICQQPNTSGEPVWDEFGESLLYYVDENGNQMGLWIPEILRSGIYNLEKKSWITERKYSDAFIGTDGFVLEQAVHIDDISMEPNPLSIVDIYNKEIAQGISIDMLVSDTAMFRYFVPTKG